MTPARRSRAFISCSTGTAGGRRRRSDDGTAGVMNAPASRLIVIAGPSRGQVIALDGAVSIGRDQSSSIVIPDLALSRKHCAVEADGDRLVVIDLDSRNGTVVNGVPIRRHELADGDQLRIGDSALIYVAGAPAQPAGTPVDGSTAA